MVHPLIKPIVYIETSVVSYLTARLSSDLIQAAHQKITIDWWENRRDQFDLYTSQLVIQEASYGDPQAASKLLNALQDIALLEFNSEVQALADKLLSQQVIPTKAREEHAKKFNNDFKAIFDDLKRQEENSPRKIISVPFKQKKLPTIQPRT